MNIAKSSLLLLSLALAIGATYAASNDTDAAPLVPHVYGNVAVVNGGASVDEAAAMKRLAPQYRMRIVFSGGGGEYRVADHLVVTRQGQVVADVPDAGPWVLLDLPPGQYQLRGDFKGASFKRDVALSSSGTTVRWVLPSSLN